MTRFGPGLRRTPKGAAAMDIRKSTPANEPLMKRKIFSGRYHAKLFPMIITKMHSNTERSLHFMPIQRRRSVIVKARLCATTIND